MKPTATQCKEFSAAWEEASNEGEVGHRVEAGLSAVLGNGAVITPVVIRWEKNFQGSILIEMRYLLEQEVIMKDVKLYHMKPRGTRPHGWTTSDNYGSGCGPRFCEMVDEACYTFSGALVDVLVEHGWEYPPSALLPAEDRSPDLGGDEMFPGAVE